MAGECWTRTTVGALCDAGILHTQTGPFGSQLHSYDYVDNGIPVVPTEAIGRRHLATKGIPHITKEKASQLSRHRVKPGDILFARRGIQATGFSAIVSPSQDGWICGTGAILLRIIGQEIDPNFLSFYLSDSQTISWLKQHAVGAVMPNLNEGIIRQLPVTFPSLSNQKAIAFILGSLDDMIELNRRMNETLEGIARAFFQSWFVDFDPVRAKLDGRTPYGMDQATADLFPDSFEDSSLGPIPKGWRVSKVTECCLRIHSGGTPSRNEPSYWENGSVPWLTSGEVRQSLITATNNFISELGLTKSSAKWVPSGSTVVALYGATAGQVSYVSVPVTTNQAVCALVPRPEFELYNYFTMSDATDHMASKAVGSAQQNISKGIIEETDTVIPSRNILDAFNSLLRPLVQTWSGNIVRSCTLAELRDTLLPKLLSGELSVDEAGRKVEAVF